MSNDIQQNLKHLVKNLPNLPGIYQMFDKNQQILYIGKAKSLKNRISSYFQKNISHPKTQALVQRIVNIKTIITRSETEALLLEQNLIKQHRPPYNILLRDDKSYLYIFISSDRPYPRLAYGRGKGKHQIGKFFGPYPSAHVAKKTLQLLQKMFQLRQCDNRFFKSRQRPCLEYQIKRCKAPCMGWISPEEYDTDVKHTLAFLNGKNHDIQQALIQKMQQYADNLDFENAVIVRNQITMLQEIQAKQAVYTLKGNADVIAICQQTGVVCLHLLTVRHGQVLGGYNYFPDMDSQNDESENLATFISLFYFQISDDLPKEIIISHPINDQTIITDALQQHFQQKIIIKHQVKKQRKQWLDLAKLNSQNALQHQLSDFLALQNRYQSLNHLLKEVLNYRAINRIECFDISHTMGEATIASCVVCDTGGLRKRDYRQYLIQNITAGDDYQAMKQAIARRYQKQPLPDMLLIDGGKGQLNIAKQTLQEMGILEQTLLVGIAKGENRKAGLEVLHFLTHEPLDLPTDHQALHLLMHIRDEAHRFAITAHRKKRDKNRGRSVLESIPKLGEKRRRDLLNHFGGMQQLLGASQTEIAQVKGIGDVLAKTIYHVLHG